MHKCKKIHNLKKQHSTLDQFFSFLYNQWLYGPVLFQVFTYLQQMLYVITTINVHCRVYCILTPECSEPPTITRSGLPLNNMSSDILSTLYNRRCGTLRRRSCSGSPIFWHPTFCRQPICTTPKFWHFDILTNRHLTPWNFADETFCHPDIISLRHFDTFEKNTFCYLRH